MNNELKIIRDALEPPVPPVQVDPEPVVEPIKINKRSFWAKVLRWFK